MARSAFQIISEAHYEMGQPGLLHCIEVLGDNFDDLTPELQDAYEEFYGELMSFVELQTEA
jgi:hypothetical protein